MTDVYTLTDAAILRLGRSVRDGTANDALVRNACVVALGLTLCTPEVYANARRFVVEAINRRAELR